MARLGFFVTLTQWAPWLASLTVVLFFINYGLIRVASKTRANRIMAFAGLNPLIALALAAAVLLTTIVHPSPAAPLASFPRPQAVLINRLTAVMLVMVSGVSSVVHRYAHRYLADDPSSPRFVSRLSLMTAWTLGVVIANNLAVLDLFWVFGDATLVSLLTAPTQRVWDSRPARSACLLFALSDSAFATALILIQRLFGTVSLTRIFWLAHHPVDLSWARPNLLGVSHPALGWITGLIFVGLMARTVQLPLQWWLPDTVDAPTPLSGLLHAGIVNLGGFLLARFSPLLNQTPVTLGIAFGVGTITALYGTQVMLTQTDVKRGLAYSTIGQMGFMVMEAGLGAYATAVFHLIAHGLYKATLFLSSGSVAPSGPAQSQPRLTSTMSPRTLVTRAAVTIALWLGLFWTSVRVWHLAAPAAAIWLIFTVATVSQAFWAVSRLVRPRWSGVLAAFLILMALAYIAEISAFAHFLGSAIAPPTLPLTWRADVVVLGTAVGVSLIHAGLFSQSFEASRGRWASWRRYLLSYRDSVYVALYNQKEWPRIVWTLARRCQRRLPIRSTRAFWPD